VDRSLFSIELWVGYLIFPCNNLEYVWYVPEMDIDIISKAWTKRCGLKVRMNDDEDFLIANDKGMCLKTQDITGHSYITNLFAQPFLLSHATMHAVVASEPQWPSSGTVVLATRAPRPFGYLDTMDSILHNVLYASRRSRFASLSVQIQSEQHQGFSVCTPTSVVLSIHRPMMECNTS
jgi:hypothetical protein